MLYSPPLTAQSLYNYVRENLYKLIEIQGVSPKFVEREVVIRSSVLLHRFYKNRNFRPAWFEDSALIPQVNPLIKTISRADQEGLRPDDYHLNKIKEIIIQVIRNQKGKGPINTQSVADLDLLLTDAFLTYGSHLSAGRINPETFDAQLQTNPWEMDLALVLKSALDFDSIEESLRSLAPLYPGYIELRQALARYRDITAKGGWPMVPDGDQMQKGERSERFAALHNRLIVSGDLDQDLHNREDLFDDVLERALQKFQKRYGLTVNGIVDQDTLEALNVPAYIRMRQIELNMERMRWLAYDLEKRYIAVNVADFQAKVVDKGQTVMQMKVVVGKDYRQTPVFSDQMTYMVLCPYWNIPKKIVMEDKLPLIRKDTDYLRKAHIKVLQGWDVEPKEIDPNTIEWLSVNADNFGYRLRQDPGPWNPLGRIKFMFPNRFGVYLHDTPSQKQFEKNPESLAQAAYVSKSPLNWLNISCRRILYGRVKKYLQQSRKMLNKQ